MIGLIIFFFTRTKIGPLIVITLGVKGRSSNTFPFRLLDLLFAPFPNLTTVSRPVSPRAALSTRYTTVTTTITAITPAQNEMKTFVYTIIIIIIILIGRPYIYIYIIYNVRTKRFGGPTIVLSADDG